MNRLHLFLSCILLIVNISVLAQPSSTLEKQKPKPYTWMFGAGWNIVDDDGRPFDNPFAVSQAWNYQFYPTRLMVDYYLNRGFSVEFAGCYNQYTEVKLINNTTNLKGTFFSADLNGKYSFYELLSSRVVDPYVSVGAGGTYRDVYRPAFRPTLNISLGMNLFFSEAIGVQLQSSAKFGVTTDFFATNSNYLQHSVGVVYKLVPRTDDISKRKYRWIKKKHKYKPQKM